jgi:flagellar basal-body rod protein FlgC
MTLSAITIGLSGMRAAEARLEATASNVANAGSTGQIPSPGATHPVYAPVRVELSEAASGGAPAGVSARLVRDPTGYVPVSDPTSPDANAQGLVALPGVDLASEMVDLIAARVQYAASAQVVRAAGDMQKKALDTFA